MPSSAKPCPSKWQRYIDYARGGEVYADWLDAVSMTDWIMTPPSDPDYISPYCMQGCTFK